MWITSKNEIGDLVPIAGRVWNSGHKKKENKNNDDKPSKRKIPSKIPYFKTNPAHIWNWYCNREVFDSTSSMLRQSLWNVSIDLYSVSYNSPPSTFVDGEVASLCMASAYIHIPRIPICNDCNDLWSFLAFYGYFMDLYGYLNFNLSECGIPKCQADRGKTVLASHLGLSAWDGLGGLG